MNPEEETSFAYSTVASSPPKRRAGRTKFRETRHPVFKGIRRRGNSERWVCEVRDPNGNKSRIWLGTFVTAEMAARAHDVAAMALRGRKACLNFADSAWRLSVPESASHEDIRKAAVAAAEMFKPLSKQSSPAPSPSPSSTSSSEEPSSIPLSSSSSSEEEEPSSIPLSSSSSSSEEEASSLSSPDILSSTAHVGSCDGSMLDSIVELSKDYYWDAYHTLLQEPFAAFTSSAYCSWDDLDCFVADVSLWSCS